MAEQSCDACEQELNARMQNFGRRRRILSGEQELGRSFLARIERLFPEIFVYMASPQRRLDKKHIQWPYNIEFVAAPLPFTASCVRHVCSCCRRSMIVTVINSRFQVACSHLLAASIGTGLPQSELRRLLAVLFTDPLSLASFASPTQLPVGVVFSGLAWILFHEYGHHVGDGGVDPSFMAELAPTLWAKAADEIDADRASLDTLLHRVTANPPLSRDRTTELLLGVELVLRAALAVEGMTRGQVGILASSGTSTPAGDILRTRFRFLEAYGSALDAQGRLNNWTATRKFCFEQWNSVLSKLGEINGLGTD